MQLNQDQIVSGDVGVPIEIDTELSDLSGLTLELIFFRPDGTVAATVTGTDGGQGPVGMLITYTTLSTDTEIFKVGNEGEWKITGKVSAGATVLRHGTPPLRVSVVAIGKES